MIDYEADFYGWTLQQAEAIRNGSMHFDRENIAEELESLGGSQRHAIRSRLTQLLLHIYKFNFQKDLRSKSWINSIKDQRDEIEQLLNDSPSLRPFAHEVVNANMHKRAWQKAADQMELLRPELTVPTPYTFEEMMTKEFEL